LRPQIAFSILDVLDPKPGRVILSNGTELRGFGIARKLTCAAPVIAAVATLGSELERQIQGATQEQPTFALSLDGFGTAAMRSLTTGHFFAQKAGGPLATTAPLYPGIRGWELAPAQTQLFSLAGRCIGHRRNSQFVVPHDSHQIGRDGHRSWHETAARRAAVRRTRCIIYLQPQTTEFLKAL
jgi:hypothetical protein